MLLRERARRSADFIEPCLPSPAKRPPAGPDWIHEIKHDGFRIMARRDAAGVRLISRNGNDLTSRFPLVATAVAALPARSCLIDGEAIATDKTGLAVFDLIRGYRAILAPYFARSICSNWMAKICDATQSNPARASLESFSVEPIQALSSISIIELMARPYFAWRASSAARASCRSGSEHPISQVDPNIG